MKTEENNWVLCTCGYMDVEHYTVVVHFPASGSTKYIACPEEWEALYPTFRVFKKERNG